MRADYSLICIRQMVFISIILLIGISMSGADTKGPSGRNPSQSARFHLLQVEPCLKETAKKIETVT